MKKRTSKHFRYISALFLTTLAVVPRASAETPMRLNLQVYPEQTVTGVVMYAGLTVTGAIGSVCSIEYIKDLAETNTPTAWRCLEFLQLPVSPYPWVDKSAPATGRRFYRAVKYAGFTNLAFIAPGTFLMGSPPNQGFEYEYPQTTVTISRASLMGKYEVTQREYLEVMGNNPSGFTTNNWIRDLSLPVERVSFSDATNYCDVLTQRERAAGRIAVNSLYRLPTEAEWEHACRAGTMTRFSFGPDPNYTELVNYAWYSENSGGTTHPVGQKLPNPWGLYDMHGNVWEWCHDTWVPGLFGGSVVDPEWRSGGDLYGVVRGGYFGIYYWRCGSPSRYYFEKNSRNSSIGFRVLLAPGEP